MIERWIDSLPIEWAEEFPEERRLTEAIKELALALNSTEGPINQAHWQATAGALIVVERRRLEPSSKWPRTHDPERASVASALFWVAAYVANGSTTLRLAEAHLRTLWRERQKARETWREEQSG